MQEHKEKALLDNVRGAKLLHLMDVIAEEEFGEYGFDTCHVGEQHVILRILFERDLIQFKDEN